MRERLSLSSSCDQLPEPPSVDASIPRMTGARVLASSPIRTPIVGRHYLSAVVSKWLLSNAMPQRVARAPDGAGHRGPVLIYRRGEGPRGMSQACHGTTDLPSGAPTGVDGVFVMGMFASGVELLGGALSRLGLVAVYDDHGPHGAIALTGYNEQLLATAAAAAGSGGGPPDVGPAEMARLLAPRMHEAKQKVGAALRQTAPSEGFGTLGLGGSPIELSCSFLGGCAVSATRRHPGPS